MRMQSVNERVESIVQSYLSGKVVQSETISRIKREHYTMLASYQVCMCALTDIGIKFTDATSLVQSWEQELNETVQLA